MPPVGGFVALCVQSHGQQCSVPRTTLHGDFFKIAFPPPFHQIKGKLSINFDAYRISHGGIKVRLEGNLQVTQKIGAIASTCKSVDIFEHCPTDVLLTCGDLLRGQKKLNFNINIPPEHVCPTPFVNSNGSLTYKLVALINRDNNWETIARKLVNFKGYHNISGTVLGPLVDKKLLQSGKITSTFTINKVIVVMGRNESLKATLELEEEIANQVDATLSFLRIINYAMKSNTDIIWSNTKRTEVHQKKYILFEWSFVVPVMSRATYCNELIPFYSVRYFLKYEVKLRQSNVGEDNCVCGEGLVEVKVGTAYNSCASEFVHGSNVTTYQGLQMDRRRSVMSLVSTLSLPPAYSELQSRSGSAFSIETLPPLYDDL